MSIKQIEHYQSSAEAENNPFHPFIKRCMEKKKERCFINVDLMHMKD